MIINFQENSKSFWPNRSRIVANEAAELGFNTTPKLTDAFNNQDLVIVQYDIRTSGNDLSFVERICNQTKLVLWINNFNDFTEDNLYKRFLQIVNYIVVPSNDDRLSLGQDGFSMQQIGVCEVFDLPHQLALNGQVPFNRELHQLVENNESSWQLSIKKLNEAGGFGLIDGTDEESAMLQLAIFTEAGLPLVASVDSPVEKIINKHHLGLLLKKDENDDEKIGSISENDFKKLVNNSWNFGQKMARGLYTRHALQKATFHATIPSKIFDPYTSVYTRNLFDIRVMDTFDTLDFIEKYHPSVSRFGDGEIALINGTDQVFQKADPELRRRLDQILRTPSDSRLLICLSDTLHDLNSLVKGSRDWWNYIFKVYKGYFQSLAEQPGTHIYGNNGLNRPYMYSKDKSHAGEIFDRIRQWWQNRDILLVEGYYTRSGVGNDLYNNARSVRRILCPSKNAWDQYDQIKNAIKQYGKNKLVLVMLGMTASVLAADLADWGQVIDLGHLDTDYQWYKMGATQNVKIPFKHTAEMNDDENIEPIHDSKYQHEILLKIDNQAN